MSVSRSTMAKSRSTTATPPPLVNTSTSAESRQKLAGRSSSQQQRAGSAVPGSRKLVRSASAPGHRAPPSPTRTLPRHASGRVLTSDERASLRSAVSTRPGSGLGPGGAAEELPQVDARPSSALSASNPRVVAFSEEDDLPTRTSRRRFERSASTGRGGVMNVLRNPAHQKQLLQERRRSVDAERHRRSASPDVGKTTAKKSPKLLALEKSGLYFPIVANGGILGGAGGERRGVDGGGVPETVRLHGSGRGNSKRSGRKHNGQHKKKNGRHSSSSTTTNRRKAKEKAARAATAATVGDGGDEGSSRSNATDGVDSPATTAPANPSKHRRSKPLPGVPDEATNDKRRQLREAAVAQAIKKSERRERTAEALSLIHI